MYFARILLITIILILSLMVNCPLLGIVFAIFSIAEMQLRTGRKQLLEKKYNSRELQQLQAINFGI